MKTTKKILENIIREELASILQEQEQKQDRRTAMEELVALIRAEEDPQKRAKLQLIHLMLSTSPKISLDTEGPSPGQVQAGNPDE